MSWGQGDEGRKAALLCFWTPLFQVLARGRELPVMLQLTLSYLWSQLKILGHTGTLSCSFLSGHLLYSMLLHVYDMKTLLWLCTTKGLRSKMDKSPMLDIWISSTIMMWKGPQLKRQLCPHLCKNASNLCCFWYALHLGLNVLISDSKEKSRPLQCITSVTLRTHSRYLVMQGEITHALNACIF